MGISRTPQNGEHQEHALAALQILPRFLLVYVNAVVERKLKSRNKAMLSGNNSLDIRFAIFMDIIHEARKAQTVPTGKVDA